MDVLRVAAGSNARSLAGCIAGVVREQGRAELQAVGAAAVNQVVKATAIARGFLHEDGLKPEEDLVLIIRFAQVMIGGKEKTAIRFIAEKR
jgi:stage V sporulation protein S